MNIIKSMLLLALLSIPVQFVNAQDTGKSIKQQVTTNFVLEAGSPEAMAVTQWLLENAPVEAGSPLIALDHIGDIRVTHTASISGIQPFNDPPVPPYMPPQGNPGDTCSVGTCSDNVSQTWEYEWVGPGSDGGWVNASYERELVVECSPL